MKPKIITTIVENDVIFMTNPKVAFVSLVKHGANRMPFKVLKYDKGGNPMKGIVQAILISKELSKEAVLKALANYKDTEIKDFETYIKYIQHDQKDFEPDSLGVTTEKEGVYCILGVLKKDVALPKEGIKKELDYATMDDLYVALYAMADMVSGTMRQENSTASFKRKTILSAIDNFRNFAENLLSNIKEMSVVKAENHPNLVKTFTEVKKEETDAEREAREATEKKAKDKKKTDEATAISAIAAVQASDNKTAGAALSVLVDSKFEGVEKKLVTLVTALQKLVEQGTEKTIALEAEIETLKAAPNGAQTIVTDSDNPKKLDTKKTVWDGLFYTRIPKDLSG